MQSSWLVYRREFEISITRTNSFGAKFELGILNTVYLTTQLTLLLIN